MRDFFYKILRAVHMSVCVAAVLFTLSGCGALLGADSGSTQSSGNDSRSTQSSGNDSSTGVSEKSNQ